MLTFPYIKKFTQTKQTASQLVSYGLSIKRDNSEKKFWRHVNINWPIATQNVNLRKKNLKHRRKKKIQFKKKISYHNQNRANVFAYKILLQTVNSPLQIQHLGIYSTLSMHSILINLPSQILVMALLLFNAH